MDLFTAMKIGGSGLSLQRTRMNVISSNLANAETTRTPEGGPYRKKSVVATASPVENGSFGNKLGESLKEVKVVGIEDDKTPPRLVYDPSHPDSDDRGYVAMPNVNVIEEMVDMINASRAYEANATSINTIKTMAQRALEIGAR